MALLKSQSKRQGGLYHIQVTDKAYGPLADQAELRLSILRLIEKRSRQNKTDLEIHY